MMQVNLLPLKPPTKRYQWQIALVAAIVVLSFSVLVGWRYYVIDEKVKQAERLLEQKKQESTQWLSEDKNLGAAAVVVNQFLVEAEALEAIRIPWITIMDTLSEMLPQNGYILELTYDAEGVFNLTAQFDGLNEIAGFIQLVLNQPMFHTVTLGEATMMGAEATDVLTSAQPSARKGYQFTMSFKVNTLDIKEKTE